MFEPLVGGFTFVTGGGTKTAIKLSRPWQVTLPIVPEKCPFCTKPREEISLPNLPAGWRLLWNLFTPHRRHRLAIPSTCWDAKTLQTLGGCAGIREALEVFRLAIKEDHGVEMATFVHVGQCAGQNLGHAHWHIMEVRVKEALAVGHFAPELLVSRNDMLDIVAAGARTGECLIVPRTKTSFDECVEAIAASLEWIITRGNKKFLSSEGRLPEFIAAVRIGANGQFRYADYCPILNMWGGTEYIFAPLEGGPVTLLWPHELTAQHLRG